jgi:hypothetical protein
MDKNRIEGKRKEVEGKLQQRLGKLIDRVRNLPDDTHDRLEREKGKRELRREQESAPPR